MNQAALRIAENLQHIRDRIAGAARRSGRSPDEITLVAVTKYVGAAEAQALVEAGCRDLGESRPQELWRKASEFSHDAVRWHFIGHLQRNKLARTLPLISWLHSGDSLRLLEAASAEGAPRGAPISALLEINVSGDATKHGFHPEEIEPLGESLATFGGVAIRGLMAMAGREGGPDDARRDFVRLRELRERLQSAWAGRFELKELSMGMSGDYEIAIEEGATFVRVGSALFEGAAFDDIRP